ncbi:MAG: hypothetical protein ACREX8_03110 [Gammaproteobacteria bacterium]
MPYLRSVEAKTALCLSGLTYIIGRRHPAIELQPFTHSSGNLSLSRTILILEARKWGAGHFLWIDADMVFRPTALVQLLARRKDVIGANYAVRGTLTRPTARGGGGYIYTTEAKAKAGEVERAERMGLGLCLMKADLFDKIGPPWFGNVAQPGGLEFGGEDDFLFDTLAAAGVECFVDHAVSYMTGHLHERILTNADTLALLDT